MKIQLDGLKILLIIGVILLLGGGNVFQLFNPKVETIKEVVTVTEVDSSTVRNLEKANSQILYLDSIKTMQHKHLSEQIKRLQALNSVGVTDTITKVVTVPLTRGIEPYVAILDTISGRDRLNLEYYHPQGLWRIEHTDFTRTKLIETEKTIVEKDWIEFTHGVQAGLYYSLLDSKFHPAVGYGFQLKFNL